MRKLQTKISRRTASFAVAAVLAGITASTASAAEWRAFVGAQSPDLASQVQSFLPNEMWIHAGDSIRWTLTSTEIHTVTFLIPGQVRPPGYGPIWGVTVGCPGNTPDGATFDGTSCVNSGLLGQGPLTVGPGLQTYSVTFPTAGNYKLVCLFHVDMQGTIHALSPATPLPHDQVFYDAQAAHTGGRLVAAGLRLRGSADSESDDEPHAATVVVGVGAVVTTTGAGSQNVTLNRFLRDVVVVNVGDTVEWTNHDPFEPHTVTFGTEPIDPRPPSVNVNLSLDGARQATISSNTDSVNSGFLALAPQDRPKLAQAPAGIARFRVTFTVPGTFNYICALHDDLDMKGTVIVH